MRGDQLAREWRIIRAIQASPSGVTRAEVAHREEAGIHTIYRGLEVSQVPGASLHAQRDQRADRRAFIDTFPSRIPPPLTSNETFKVPRDITLHDFMHHIFKVMHGGINRWVLSFGPEATVLVPGKLRGIVRKNLSRNLAQYSRPPISINLLKEMTS